MSVPPGRRGDTGDTPVCVPHLPVVLEDVGGGAELQHVVDDEFTEAGEENAALVQLLDAALAVLCGDTGGQ